MTPDTHPLDKLARKIMAAGYIPVQFRRLSKQQMWKRIGEGWRNALRIEAENYAELRAKVEP